MLFLDGGRKFETGVSNIELVCAKAHREEYL